jgi:hypothetical protein
MNKKYALSFVAGLCMMFAAASAMALGIGAYIDAAGGETHRKVRTGSFEDTGGRLTNYGFRAGLIFDTCVACDNEFSYRFKLGGGLSWADLLNKIDYNSLHMSHTFAFAAVKNDYIKFWIGPQIGLSYSRGSGDRLFLGTDKVGPLYYFGTTPTPELWHFGVFKERTKYFLYNVNAGPAFGVNLNFGDYVTLALEAGVTYGYTIGRQERELYFAVNPLIPYNKFRESVADHGIEAYGSAAFLFRFVDTYQ